MDTYGEFSASVSGLDGSLEEALSSWKDETGRSYAVMNEGVKASAAEIWMLYQKALEARGIAESNYNEDDFNAELNLLGSEISAL